MDRQTFDRMLLASLPDAMRFAIKLTGDASAAEDLVHDALVKASSVWQSFRAGSALRTWFFQIIVNRFRDGLRRRGGVSDVKEEPADPRRSDPASAMIGEELSALVARHVSSLPPRQREVLILIAYEGFTPAQAAGVLGMTEENARVTLHHARKRLKTLLRPYLKLDERENRTRSIPAE